MDVPAGLDALVVERQGCRVSAERLAIGLDPDRITGGRIAPRVPVKENTMKLRKRLVEGGLAGDCCGC